MQEKPISILQIYTFTAVSGCQLPCKQNFLVTKLVFFDTSLLADSFYVNQGLSSSENTGSF